MENFNNLHVGLNIDTPRSHNRTIVSIIKIGNQVNNGFKIIVRIGLNTTIEVSRTMLITIVNASLHNNGIYNNQVFRKYYNQKANNHPCYIHVVGMLLVKTGVASVRDKNSYNVTGQLL